MAGGCRAGDIVSTSALEFTPEGARAIVAKPEIRRMVEVLDKIVDEGLSVARGILDGSNPDAAIPLKDASTRTRFAMDLTKQALHDRREQKVAERQLGVLILKERMDAGAWEKHAADVDRTETAKAFIDVEARTK